MTPPIPVCCALLEKRGRVLIAQRPLHKHLGGQWEFPGGKIEDGESAEDALHREIAEELGCRVSITATLAPVVHNYADATIELHPFVVALTVSSPPPRAREHIAMKWLSRDQLAEATLAPADTPVLAAYLDYSA